MAHMGHEFLVPVATWSGIAPELGAPLDEARLAGDLMDSQVGFVGQFRPNIDGFYWFGLVRISAITFFERTTKGTGKESICHRALGCFASFQGFDRKTNVVVLERLGAPTCFK